MAKDSLSELKFKIYQKNTYVKYDFGYDRAIVDSLTFMPLELWKIPIIWSSVHFFAKVAHTENEFGIQIYHQIIQTKLGFGTIDQSSIFERVMSLKLRKSSFIWIFRLLFFFAEVAHTEMYVQVEGA